ncbi:hypothetical protein MKY34_08820 [Sporosarcina sp. FSL K6-1522]|uniref:hypothetical protein n=1 Tax=Sporosarcina sp. FSL K6-1522 TaxID=2921554 RepID=UPI00315A678C
MVLKMRQRTVAGKMAMGKEYPKISFEQVIDIVAMTLLLSSHTERYRIFNI